MLVLNMSALDVDLGVLASEPPDVMLVDPPYARRIELGFVGQDSLGRHYHQAAQPYMAPAFSNKQDEARQMIKDEVTGALDERMNLIAAGRH